MIFPPGDKGRHGLAWLCVVGGIVGFLLLLSASDEGESKHFVANEVPPTGATNIPFQIIDHSRRGTIFLFSKTMDGDLWFRDERGRERYIASNVVRASFSPDGTKVAYGNMSDEFYVTSLAGKRLAELTRVRDHVWASNSAAVTLSALAAIDYPETEQTIVYHLEPEQKLPPQKGE